MLVPRETETERATEISILGIDESLVLVLDLEWVGVVVVLRGVSGGEDISRSGFGVLGGACLDDCSGGPSTFRSMVADELSDGRRRESGRSVGLCHRDLSLPEFWSSGAVCVMVSGLGPGRLWVLSPFDSLLE